MDTTSFFELDFHGSLFPLKTNLLVIRHHHKALAQYIAKILSDDPAHVGDNFLTQTRAHAAKAKNHLAIALDRKLESQFLTQTDRRLLVERLPVRSKRAGGAERGRRVWPYGSG